MTGYTHRAEHSFTGNLNYYTEYISFNQVHHQIDQNFKCIKILKIKIFRFIYIIII
jgi:hypothetical protein